MLDELKIEAEKYLEISTLSDIPDELIQRIFNQASTNKEEFENYLPSLGYGLDSAYMYFIEAIWKHGKTDEWDDFLFREMERLISKAEANDENAIHELTSIMYMTHFETENKEFFKKRIKYLVTKLSSPIPDMREQCSSAIFDMTDIGELELETDTILALHKLLNDDVLKTRVVTYSSLKDFGQLPRNFKWSMLDKIKIKVLGLSSYVD